MRGIPTLDEVNAELARRSLSEFIRVFWKYADPSDYLHNWHIDAICDHLEAVSRGEIRRLIINIPPRHMKSLAAAVHWPAWDWIDNPQRRWLFASYALNLSKRDSIKCRRIIASPLYQQSYDISLSGDQNEKLRFENSKGGYRLATSVDGGLTGEGGDVACFPADAVVWTEVGPLAIRDIVRDRLEIRVPSFNTATGEISAKPVMGWHENPESRLVEIGLSDGATLVCTPDHKIWTARGWVQAQNLTALDVLPGGGESDNRSPVFVGDVGHADATYCLTVKDNHTFFVGSGKVIVSNCVDDAHNVREVESDATRQSALDWWDQSMSTRLNNPKTGSFVVIMQRTHHRDLVGHILANEMGWDHLCLPAEYDKDHPTPSKTKLHFVDPRKKQGELLWESRVGQEELDELKGKLGKFGTAGQLQQQPSPKAGGILEAGWWRMWPDRKPLPEFVMIVQSWDTACSEKDRKENAQSARTTWGIFRDDEGRMSMMLISHWADHEAYPGLRKRAQRDFMSENPDAVIIEQKSSGTSLIQDLRSAGVPVIAFNPTKDKEARANIASPLLQSGRIWRPDRRWADSVVEECAAFPMSQYKDTVDTVTQAIEFLRKGQWVAHPEDPEHETKKYKAAPAYG